MGPRAGRDSPPGKADEPLYRSPVRVDFWFHPGCPWTWVTSRWLLEVAPQRDLDIHWRSFSLTLLNGCADVPQQYRARAEVGETIDHRAGKNPWVKFEVRGRRNH